MSHLDAPYAPPGDPAPSTPSAQPPFGATAPPGVPAGPARRSGLALAAFVVGLVALLLSAIPVVNVVSIVGGIVAVVLAVLALRTLVPGATGKGFAIAGLVLGAVSVVVATIIWVVMGLAVQAWESGDLEAALAEAAQDVAVSEDGAAQDAAVGEEAATDDAAASDPASAPAAGTEDFSDISCDILGEEAVLLSQETAAGEAALVKIRESAVVEDNRTDYTLPTGVEESLVLSCRGTAAWDDTAESSVLTELTIDADGELFVAFVPE